MPNDTATSTAGLRVVAGPMADPGGGQDGRTRVFRPFVGSPEARGHHHHVTAIVVTHNGEQWLGTTLDALASQRHPADIAIVVDTGSRDASPEVAACHGVVAQVAEMPPDTGFGAAIKAGLARADAMSGDPGTGDPGTGEDGEVIRWVWLLHDDCAPQPGALEHLLGYAEDSPSAAVLGPKVRGWHDRDLLVECGLSIDGAGRRVTGLEPDERDQGQHDNAGDVFAVGSAGMLVRRDVWERLGGFDPALPIYRDDIEFCWRARRADERVVVVPTAVVHHLEAASRGRRTVEAPEIGADPARLDRRAAIYSLTLHTPAWRLPLTSVRLLLGSMLRAVSHLTARSPRRAAGELRAWLSVHARPGQVVAARRRSAALTTVPGHEVDRFRPGASDYVAQLWDSLAIGVSGTRDRARGSGRWEFGPALLVFAVVGLVSLIATRSLWSGAGYLEGGALLPATGSGQDLWERFRAGWSDVGLGSVEPQPPYLVAVIALAALPVLDPNSALLALFLVVVPGAALSAFVALRGLTHGLPRAALSAAYALIPVSAATTVDGRLGTALVVLTLPLVVRLGARFALSSRPGPLPTVGPRSAVALAAALSVATAGAPIVWPLASVGCLLAAVVLLRRMWVWPLLLASLLAPAALLYPWSRALLQQPNRLWFEAGVTDASLMAGEQPGWRLVLLDPGGLGPWTWLVGVSLMLVALLAVLPARGRAVAVSGWLLVLAGLLAAIVQSRVPMAVPGTDGSLTGYPGAALALVAVGMVVAASRLWPLPDPGDEQQQSPRTAVPAVAAVVVLVGPALAAALWTTQWDGPLQRGDGMAVPAFVAREGESADRIRTLVLGPGADGGAAYTVINGGGPTLGDADTPPAAASWRPIDTAVGQLVAGVGGGELATLASFGVRYVVVAEDRAPETAQTLDATNGLQRLSSSEGQGLWRIEGVTARVQQVDDRSVSGLPAIEVGTPADRDGYLAQTQASGAEGVVTLGQTPLIPWRATVGGEVVEVQDRSGLAVVPIPASQTSSRLAAGISPDGRSRDLLIPLAGLIACGVLLVPAARRSDLVADPLVDVSEGGS